MPRRNPLTTFALPLHGEPGIEVVGYTTQIALGQPFPQEWTLRWMRITVDDAHTLIERPYVYVKTDHWGSPSLFYNPRDAFETAWTIGAIALTNDEAYEVVSHTAEDLWADIQSGNIKRGAHDDWMPPNPLEPPMEGELRAYREQILRALEEAASTKPVAQVGIGTSPWRT